MATPVIMFAPDGSTGEIPFDKVAAAQQAGFKRAMTMVSPDGKSSGFVPEDRVNDAAKSGFRFGTIDKEQPSNASLYGKSLFDPVGSGAHEQGFLGGLEQIGGRAMQAMAAPVLHPIDTAVGMAKTLGTSPTDPNNPLFQRLVQGGEEWKKDPALALENAAGDIAGTVEGGRISNAAIRGVSPSPALGPINRALPSAVERGILPSVMQGAKSSATSTARALVPSLVDGPPDTLITRAIKPGKNNINWNADVQRALPLMKSAEEQLGRPIQGIDDALEATSLAKKSIWRQFLEFLGPAKRQGAVIDGNQIADAMMNSIDKRTAIQNPQLLQRVQKVADTYRKPISLGDAEDFLQSANKDLNSYYAKNKVGQQVALNDPEISSTVAEASALRNSLYAKLDKVSGPGAAQLKQAYGSLTNMEKELSGRQLVAARQNPESLSEQISTVRGAGKIVKGIATFDPGDVIEGAQNLAVSKALKTRNTSDAMIERAFAKAQPASPFPQPVSPRLAGLLQRGPIQASGPAESSNPLSVPPPQNYTTRAQRLGLLLPERAGGRIPLPYYPEMSGGERLAAYMQMLRRNPQLALPEKASPLLTPPPQD